MSEWPVVKSPIPSAGRFVEALRARWPLHERRLAMLQAHYDAPNRTVTAPELASLVGYSGYRSVNRWYSHEAEQIGRLLNWQPEGLWLGVFVLFDRRGHTWHWIMRPELAQALEILGVVTPAAFRLSEELDTSARYPEGAKQRITINAYERNAEARQRCIAHHGCRCAVCGFDFQEVYGALGTGFIHVHHLIPLSAVDERYAVDPIVDLRPVCPNCHAMLHRQTPPLTIEELRSRLVLSRF
jgi:5-methylcytosine-specific restriction enzyme A